MKKVLSAAIVAAAAMAVSCGGNESANGITKGSSSQFDSLSYAMGTNVSYVITRQMAPIPFNYETVYESFENMVFDKSEMTNEEAMELLNTYFTEKARTRMQEVETKRDSADSVALANGADSMSVAEARAALGADESMFENDAEREQISTAFGVNIGYSMVMSKFPIQTYWFLEALKDAANKEEMKMDDATANRLLNQYQTVELPAKNLEASQEWLAEIEKQSGVQKTETGILYKIENAGDASLQATDDRDVVHVIYTGKTRNGDVFDSSRLEDMGEPQLARAKAQLGEGEELKDQVIDFPLNRVIPGWTEGMKLVGKGGRISLWIPAELAYGAQGAPQAGIGPNDALYFDVELVDVVPFVEEAAATEE